MTKNFWDERFGAKEYIYGEEPNIFFAEQINKLEAGSIILPCEGEGRNAVYAATRGWNVKAFDSSDAGKAKALRLADKKNVTIDYQVEDAVNISYPENSVDVVAFIYSHFPPAIRKNIHQKASQWLKPGGKMILEVFNPNQLQNNSGGPKDPSMLYTEAIINEDFKQLNIELLQTLQVELNEGNFHKGKADIIRFVGTKK